MSTLAGVPWAVTPEKVEAVIKRLIAVARPRKIILFGSYAYGWPTEDSDVDLMVIMPHDREAYRTAAEISLALRPDFPTDVMARSPQTIRQQLQTHDAFIQEIMQKGVSLHEAGNAAVGREGRRRLRRRRLLVASA
jgi:predicted nucleotidyltransferase